MLADLVALAAHALASLKRLVQGRRHQGVPYFLTDLLRHSVLWPANRLAASRPRTTQLSRHAPEGQVWTSAGMATAGSPATRSSGS
jgi:hypothetical protein